MEKRFYFVFALVLFKAVLAQRLGINPALSARISTLNSGVGALNSGIGALNSGIGALNSGIGAFNSGIGALNSRTGGLNSGIGALNSGVLGFGSASSGSVLKAGSPLTVFSVSPITPSGLRAVSDTAYGASCGCGDKQVKILNNPNLPDSRIFY